MINLQTEICTALAANEFGSRLTADCLRWREHRGQYAIANVIRHAADARLSDELFNTLTDTEFRDQRRSIFGINSLRDDLRLGLDFFGHQQLDLLRYVQVLFLEQGGAVAATTVHAHQRHRQEFSEFLQLDIPPKERREIGVHRVLGRLFPMVIEDRANTELSQETMTVTTVQLVGYEVGAWRCACGATIGQARRFDHSCPCGRAKGNGSVTGETPICAECGQPPTYTVCPQCRTRVTLDLFWEARDGKLHPSAYRLPLTVDLVARHLDGSDERRSLVLIELPLMLGVRERNHAIMFEPPDVFWIGDGASNSPWENGQLLSLPDAVHYDRQKGLRKALEAALRRTFQERAKSRSLRNKLIRVFSSNKRNATDTATLFTRAFERRLTRSIAVDARGGELIKLVDLSSDCIVSSSPLLQRNMAWVNRRQIRQGAFVAPCLVHVTTAIQRSILGQDTLTATPMDRVCGDALGDDGIVPIGRVVRAGDILIGAESPKSHYEMTAEEKLLHAIFGHSVKGRKDRSLVFARTGTGRVLSVHVRLAHDWGGPEIRPAPGKFVSENNRLGHGILAQIGVTLVVAQPLEVGDTLHTESSRTVVCRIASGATLMRTFGLPTEPDVVVASDHPWAPPVSASSAHSVRIGLAASGLLGEELTSRATGGYSLITQQPLCGERLDTPAQELTPRDFHWLFEQGAPSLALELYGPRCDCVEWRSRLYETLVKGDRRLAGLRSTAVSTWNSPADSPSEVVRYWDLLLRAACIQTTLDGGKLSFRPLDPDDVLRESSGEVKNSQTINSRTYRAEKDGLFCERIFGPERDFECACGKYRGLKHRGTKCDRCSVEVTHSRVRRLRMGHIELAAPVVHTWYYRAAHQLLVEVLGMSAESLDDLVQQRRSVVTDPGASPLRIGEALNEDEYSRAQERFKGSGLLIDTGSEAVEALLRRSVASPWQKSMLTRAIIIRRLPVLPPDLRPLLLLDSGNIAPGDLNDHYRRIIYRNNRLKKLRDLNAPSAILRNEKRELQYTVDALLDNDRNTKAVMGIDHRPLACVARQLSRLVARDGALRDGFLRRPVDYSARTRLIAEIGLDRDTCLLPDRLAWQLYQPLLIARLKLIGAADTIKLASHQLKQQTKEAWAALEAVCATALVLAAPASGPWPLVALKLRLTADLAVKVQPDLLDHIGWDNLGQRVLLFAVLTAEAEREAREHLLPSKLSTTCPAVRNHASGLSPFDCEKKHLIDEIARWAAHGHSFALGHMDHFLLCTGEAFDAVDSSGK